MAELPTEFDPSQHKDMQDFSPVPPGRYVTKVMSSEMKDTRDGSGQMLVLNFEIVAGSYTGKGFTSRLNLVNANPTAVKIANEELATLTRACGLGPIKNSDALHNIALVTNLKLTPGDGKYGPSNEVVKYESAAGMTEPPVNPDPDERTLAIMAGEITTGEKAPPASAQPVPAPPSNFAPPPPAAPPAPAAPAPAAAAPAAPAAPAPAPAPAAAAPAATPAAGNAPPW